MDRTYAETTGHAPFDWNKWLDAAIESPPEMDEIYWAAEKAKEWTTCACGNQCAIIPRWSNGEPDDELLEKLGVDFHFALRGALQLIPSEISSRMLKVKEILANIEARSAILIQEELTKLNAQ